MANYDQIANIMLGNTTEVCTYQNQIDQQNIADSYYNAYNVPESVLIKRRALRNYQINQTVVNQFYKNPFFQMKDKKVYYVKSLSNVQYMIVENILEGSLNVYRSCNFGWSLVRNISDKNNCEELLLVLN